MCRLYGFCANEPTKVECTLVHAQNALMVQSREDLAGQANAQGWSIATYEDHHLHVERQAWAAYKGQQFRQTAARIFSRQVLAHVRRATVGALQVCAPNRTLLDVLRHGLRQIVEWCRELGSTAGTGLNVILTDGEQMVGSRIGRTLYYVEREGVHDCEICGFPHVHHDPPSQYRAAVVASEPISHENWREVPEYSVYRVSELFRLESEPL